MLFEPHPGTRSMLTEAWTYRARIAATILAIGSTRGNPRPPHHESDGLELAPGSHRTLGERNAWISKPRLADCPPKFCASIHTPTVALRASTQTVYGPTARLSAYFACLLCHVLGYDRFSSNACRRSAENLAAVNKNISNTVSTLKLCY